MFQGKPFNIFVTINIKDNKSDYNYQKIFSLINRAKNVWIRNHNKRNNIPHEAPRSACVFEKPLFNLHVHWLIYIPFDLINTFKKKLPKWLKRYQGFIEDDSIDIQLVNPYTLKTISNYMAKGIDPKWADFFHLGPRACFQGEIHGQRMKLSRNLGRTSLKRSGFKAALQRNEWETLYPELASQYERPANWCVKEVVPQRLTDRKFPSMQDWLRMLCRNRRRELLASTSMRTGPLVRNSQILKQLGY